MSSTTTTPIEFWFSSSISKDFAIPAECAYLTKKRYGEISEETTYEEFLELYKDHIIDLTTDEGDEGDDEGDEP